VHRVSRTGDGEGVGGGQGGAQRADIDIEPMPLSGVAMHSPASRTVVTGHSAQALSVQKLTDAPPSPVGAARNEPPAASWQNPAAKFSVVRSGPPHPGNSKYVTSHRLHSREGGGVDAVGRQVRETDADPGPGFAKHPPLVKGVDTGQLTQPSSSQNSMAGVGRPPSHETRNDDPPGPPARWQKPVWPRTVVTPEVPVQAPSENHAATKSAGVGTTITCTERAPSPRRAVGGGGAAAADAADAADAARRRAAAARARGDVVVLAMVEEATGPEVGDPPGREAAVDERGEVVDAAAGDRGRAAR
jgi:hypothetical protein